LSGPIVVYDACVLYSAPLRDLLMHVAVTGLYRARWTEAIHDEWVGHLLENRPDLKREQILRTRDLMNVNVPGSLVTGYEEIIPTVSLPDPDDRHVLAAAIRAGAGVIVTFNLRDFPAEALRPHHITARHPDDFLATQFDAEPDAICLAARRQRAGLKNPPKTVDEYLSTLEAQGLPQTVARLRTRAERI